MRSLKAEKADRVLTDGEKRKKKARTQTTRAMPRRNRRRKLAVIGGSIALTGIVATGAWGLHQGWHLQAIEAADRGLDDMHRAAGLSVNEVTITGRHRAGPEVLRHALQVQVGDPILRLDLTELKDRLESIGWVREASVSRHLPGRLHIHIEERKPFARWQIKRRTALIDNEGEVILRDTGARFKHLPRLVGPQANRRAAELFDLLEGAPRLAAQVKSASLVRERRWDIGMTNGITIKLPEEAPEEAWARFNEVDRRDGLMARRLKLIDLRVPGRVIVRLKDKPENASSERET